MKIFNVKQGSDEWFNLKLGKFSASNAQTIQSAGKGLETLVFQKAAEILSGKHDESYSNLDIKRGNEFEDIARSSYEMETGKEVKQVGFCQLNEFVGASPDGLVGGNGLIEIKSPRDYNFLKIKVNHKPETAHFWQMHMQMYVTRRKWCDYVVFHENFSDLVILRVERDEGAIEKIKIGLEKGIDKLIEILEALEYLENKAKSMKQAN